MDMFWKISAIGIVAIATVSVALAASIYHVNNVEHPRYTVAVADGDIEVREYPRLIVAEVIRAGDRRGAVNAGFSTLAEYIFAKRRSGEGIPMTAPVTRERGPIAMTAPVTQERTGASQMDASWRVRFIMPAKYTLDSLPKPTEGDVEIKETPSSRRAAIRFSGIATDDVLATKERSLRDWLAGRDLPSDGPATYAYYNAPFTPGPLRRNEIWIELAGAGIVGR